ncbi:Alpha/Beta hydrolase protein [Hyaloraphidium curvatum]|nr:Alpha/Beta hydrolase protein [Hyaloraphidium curvatum]
MDWFGEKKERKGPAPVETPLPRLPHNNIHFRLPVAGETLDCLFYPAPDYFHPQTPGPRFCYVFGHGGADHQRAKWVRELCHRVVAAQEGYPGISVATLDFLGNGESTGSTTYSNHEAESHHYHALIAAITDPNQATRPIPHAVTVLALGGHSKGGIAALFHAVNYPNDTPDCILNASPLFFQQGNPANKNFFRKGLWEEIKRTGKKTTSKYRHLGKLHDYYITAEDIAIREKMDVAALTEQVCKVKPDIHLVTITGSDDLIAPPVDMEHYAKYMPPGRAELFVIPDVGHQFKAGHEVEMLAGHMRTGLTDAKERWLQKHGKLAML